MGWNQTQYDTNVTAATIPSGCYLYGGASDTIAEDMLGRHLPSTIGVVRADPNAGPISVWINPDTTTPFLSSTISSDSRGVLPVFAVPGGIAPIWADFGQGSVAVKPWDTDKRLVTHSSNVSDPHGSQAAAKTYTDSQVAAISAKMVFTLKTADQFVNNSTVLVNETQMTTGVLPANSTWLFRSYLKYTSPTTGPGIKFALSAPVGASYDWSPVGLLGTLTSDAGTIRLPSATSGTKALSTYTATPLVAIMQGVVMIGSTAGAITLQFAQSIATAENTALMINSHWKWDRVV
jgi:hypothetical protein